MKKIVYLVFVMMITVSMLACDNNSHAVENERHQENVQAFDTPGMENPDYEGKYDKDPGTAAHNEAEDSNTLIQNRTEDSSKPSIAGISLGDPVSKVEMILGKDYEEALHEEMGHFDELYYLRKYEGISLIIGKDSQKVLEIDVTSDKYETWLGDKVGYTAGVIFPKYREKYTEPESIHTGSKLEGWFELGDGLVLIFDFDKDDGMIVNSDITEDSKVELIKLANMRYID